MVRERVKIQGFDVDTYDFNEAVEFANNNYGQVVTINPEMIFQAKKDSEFSRIVKDAELVIPDGIGVELGLKILGHKVKRIAGIEFAREMINVYSKKGKSIALIGAKSEVVELASDKLKNEVQGLNISYVQDGYFDNQDFVVENLKASGAELVLVALGSPKQEEFIVKAKSVYPNALYIGVGGSFDVWSGQVKRAPEIYQKLGLEWLYRTVKEPQRFKRIFPTLPLFMLSVLVEKFFKK